jgi:hypothetical protein
MKQWVGLVGALVVLVLLVLGGRAWLEDHDQKLAGKYERAALVEKLQRSEAEKSALLAENNKLREIKQPREIVKEIPKYIPFHVETRPSELPGVSADGGGEVPPEIVVPPGEIPAFWTYVLDCRECKIRLAARDAEVENLQEQIKVVEKSKKNTFWNKAKYFVIGGAMGAAAGYAASR